MSADLKDRIRRHNGGYEKTTKPYRPFLLLYWEVFDTQAEAHLRERALKLRTGISLPVKNLTISR